MLIRSLIAPYNKYSVYPELKRVLLVSEEKGTRVTSRKVTKEIASRTKPAWGFFMP